MTSFAVIALSIVSGFETADKVIQMEMGKIVEKANLNTFENREILSF